jgi:hypothetical protein
MPSDSLVRIDDNEEASGHSVPKIVPRKSCARSAKSYSYRSATMGSTRMARRAGT